MELIWSTATFRPSKSITSSFSLVWFSKAMWYWKPEQPPPTTATRRAVGTGLCRFMISLTLLAATDVRLIIMLFGLHRRNCLQAQYNITKRQATSSNSAQPGSRLVPQPSSPVGVPLALAGLNPLRAPEQDRVYKTNNIKRFSGTLSSTRETASHKIDASMKHKVTLLPGEGIGPEVSAAVRRILDATGVQIEWEELGARALSTDKDTTKGDVLNSAAVESVRRNRVALKGPMATAIAGGAPSVNVALRKSLDMYANLRPVKNLPGVKSHFEGVDVVLVRENTEDLYSGLEHEVVPGVVESLKIITAKASTRIARFAFEYARKHGRKKIHAIHKANIMKLGDGLFLRSVRAVAEEFEDIDYKELIVDNACMQIVIDPEQFDMLLLPNLYGDVMSDLAAGLVGGLGVVPSGNIGDECAMFEAVHGTAPDIAGKGLANPTALLMSATLMLRHLGEWSTADRIAAALQKVYKDGKRVTRDVGGMAGTQEFTEAVIAALPRV